MAKEIVTGNKNRVDKTANVVESTQTRIQKMMEAADKRRTPDAAELFPPVPLPPLIYGDNPKARYAIWYKSLGAFKRKYLKGPAYHPVRKEICLFLKEGNEKGMDSRMASQALMKEADDICRHWLMNGGGQDSVGLYLQFVDLNKRWVELAEKLAKEELLRRSKL